MVKSTVDNWQPAQHTLAETPDLRGIGTGPKGYKERNENMKRKMTERDEEDEDDGPTAMEQDELHAEQSTKRRKAEGSKYIPVSGSDGGGAGAPSKVKRREQGWECERSENPLKTLPKQLWFTMSPPFLDGPPQVYERAPKAPSERAGKVMKSSISTTWERKMKDKAERQHFLGMKREALAEAKDKRKVSAGGREDWITA